MGVHRGGGFLSHPPNAPYLTCVVRKGSSWTFSTLLVATIWRRSDLGGGRGGHPWVLSPTAPHHPKHPPVSPPTAPPLHPIDAP